MRRGVAQVRAWFNDGIKRDDAATFLQHDHRIGIDGVKAIRIGRRELRQPSEQVGQGRDVSRRGSPKLPQQRVPLN